MSDFAAVRTRSGNNSDDFAGIRIRPSRVQAIPSFLDRVGQLGKGALAGFSRAALEEAAGQAQAGVMEVAPGVSVPISTSSATANIPQKGIKSLEAMNPSKNDKLGNILHHAGEFGGGVASFPMLPGRVAASTAKSLLPKFAKDVGTGTTIGGISGVLQNSGVDPLAADIGTTLALPVGMGGAQTAGRGVRNLLHRFSPQAVQEGLNPEVGGITTKALHKLLGLGPKGLNIEAAQAARDLGVDLPAAVLTDSKLTGLADQYIKKAPYFGNKLDKKYFNAEEQIKNTLEDIYNKTGPAKTLKIEAEIAKLYEMRAKELPKEASILPKNTKQAIDKIKIDTAILSPDEKKLELIKKQVSPEIFEKIQKLGTVSKALALKNKNIPNPSGTAATSFNTAALIYGLFNPIKGAATALGYYGATKLLTDKKFLDLALKYAENPNKNTLNSLALNKRIKEVTGYSTVAIKNALEKQNNEATVEK